MTNELAKAIAAAIAGSAAAVLNLRIGDDVPPSLSLEIGGNAAQVVRFLIDEVETTRDGADVVDIRSAAKTSSLIEEARRIMDQDEAIIDRLNAEIDRLSALIAPHSTNGRRQP